MHWVKGTVSTLMERSQTLCWPHCLQCSLETAPRSMPGAEPAVQGCWKISPSAPQKVWLPACSNPSPPCHLQAAVSPSGWVQLWHQAWWPGSRVFPRARLAPSPGVGCKGCAVPPARTAGHGMPVVPPVHPSPIAVPSVSRPGAEPASPLSRSSHGGSADLPVLPAGAGGCGRR